jgi:hypothetical protein
METAFQALKDHLVKMEAAFQAITDHMSQRSTSLEELEEVFKKVAK